MSRGNAFKLSANMALGGSDYGNADIQQIKNSLKLLKAKKNQRQMENNQMNNYGYSASIQQSKNCGGLKNDYNYQAVNRNNYPNNTKEMRPNYGNGAYGNQYSELKSYNSNSKQNYYQNDPYEYTNKPPSYPQENITRNNRPAKSVLETENYQSISNYGSRNAGGKSSTMNTRASESSSYSSKPQPTQQRQHRQVQEEPKYYNNKEQRSIKEVNRQNQVDIVQYDPSDLRPCRVCGRRFNPQSIAKHESNCKQVFQKKRKEFNTQEQRMIDGQQKKLMKKGQAIEQKLEAQQKNQKIPKWKAQSLAFRVALKQNRNESMDPTEVAMIQQAQNQMGVKCPHCGRKFNDTAGSRHIKFCQEQAKKNQIKKKK